MTLAILFGLHVVWSGWWMVAGLSHLAVHLLLLLLSPLVLGTKGEELDAELPARARSTNHRGCGDEEHRPLKVAVRAGTSHQGAWLAIYPISACVGRTRRARLWHQTMPGVEPPGTERRARMPSRQHWPCRENTGHGRTKRRTDSLSVSLSTHPNAAADAANAACIQTALAANTPAAAGKSPSPHPSFGTMI